MNNFQSVLTVRPDGLTEVKTTDFLEAAFYYYRFIKVEKVEKIVEEEKEDYCFTFIGEKLEKAIEELKDEEKQIDLKVFHSMYRALKAWADMQLTLEWCKAQESASLKTKEARHAG